MPRTGQFLTIAAMGKAMLDTFNYQRLLPRLAVLVALAMVTGILGGLLIVGLFYASYILLIRHGLDADAAFLVTGIGIAVTAMIFAILTAGYIRKLRHALQPLSPMATGAGEIASAFLDGLRTPPHEIHAHIN